MLPMYRCLKAYSQEALDIDSAVKMQKSFDSMGSSPFGMGGLNLDDLGLGDLLKSPNVRIITKTFIKIRDK